MRQFLSATEFAKIINRDPKTVINWVKKKWIGGSKRVGHVYQIPASEIKVYENSTHYPPQKWHK